MLNTPKAIRGAVTAPHHLAATSGLAVLREGGNAIEAALAAAATIAVVYPHMTGLGGDAFWLIAHPRGEGYDIEAIDACGAAGAGVDPEPLRTRGMDMVPGRGPLSACTVAGTVSGWRAALDTSAGWGGRMGLGRLFEDAVHYAREGVPVASSLHRASVLHAEELSGFADFVEMFFEDGAPPAEGAVLKQPALARTLERLIEAGLEDFYSGALARDIAGELERAGVALSGHDLERHSATRPEPLTLRLGCGTVYNLPPPTQGLVSLMILGLFERLGVREGESFAHIHGLVEAAKLAFRVGGAHLADPAVMKVDAASLLEDAKLDRMAAGIEMRRALHWPDATEDGDTIWLGVVDGEGRAVSFIQSLYQAFGSGIALPESGLLWQCRGASFALGGDSPNQLAPGRKPFHTLNPAMAMLDDGRLVVYGTMGAYGQAQTQSAIFSRHVMFARPLQESLTAPRWYLEGSREASEGCRLLLESRFDGALVDDLRKAGHAVRVMGPFESQMGHAGALVRHRGGVIEAAADPRGDGAVAAY